jgi:polyphosphate kinase 2 (PPK2 family)
MSKKPEGKTKERKKKADGKPADAQPAEFTAKVYRKELKRLHVELVKMQQWVVQEGLKVCIVFEGRDGAGKGGVIKAITERVSPRVFRWWHLLDGTGKPRSLGSAISAFSLAAKWSSWTVAGTTAPA